MVPVLRCVKLSAKILIALIVLYLISSYQNHFFSHRRVRNFRIWRKSIESKDLKYILIWSKDEPDLEVLRKEREAFVENKCLYTNCYVTTDRNLTKNAYTNFDAIVISGRNLLEALPSQRYSNQTFIFAAKESADNYPMCDSKFDNYFNWTWTYKINSDIIWTYFTVFDKAGHQIAPSPNPEWITSPTKLSTKLGQEVLRMKKHPVAWFASNCYTRSKRETFVLKLKHALKWFGLDIHVVGSCGTKQCPVENDKECSKVLERYYFYLAFENSLSEDYVTEKVLKALLHYTVPVVFGGANYSRFLPPGSYIDAQELGPKKTAVKLASLINNQSAYLDYFNWHNHYTFDATQKSVCTLCEWLNKGVRKNHVDFREWWNPVNETCWRRSKRSTIRSRLLEMMLRSTCSVDEVPQLVSFFKDSRIYNVNQASRLRKIVRNTV